MSIFKLPDLGEGLPDAEIREWHVKVGDEIKTDEPLVSMETAKAVVEVPSPQNGVIKKLYGDAGDVINTGESLVEFEGLDSSNGSNGSNNSETKDTASAANDSNKKSNSSTVAGKIEAGDQVVEDNFIIGRDANKKTNNNIKSTPAVRALARQLGVDISKVKPTGHNNLITLDDINNASRANLEPTEAEKALGESKPLKGVRKAMAAAMTEANHEVCAATLFDDADIFNWPEKSDITVRLTRALVTACKAEPGLNAWYNSKNNTIIIPDAIHMGLAVDSEEGLFVPVINNLESMNMSDISGLRDHINTLKTQIKNRTIPQEQLKGNTITLSNIGTVAGRYASPVVVPPTVAIIAIGKLYNTAVLSTDNQLENHRNIPVSLTFDHRAVTGGEAARFLKSFIADLESAD